VVKSVKWGYTDLFQLMYLSILLLIWLFHLDVVEVVLRHFHQSCYMSSPVVVLLLEGDLVSWSLAMDERGGHEDLRGSDRLSVIPYVHGRTELYCAQVCLA
jgi:hypothetical protein